MSLKAKRSKDKLDSFENAKIACKAAYDKKGEDISLLDVSKLTVVADYFLIITANSKPHIQSLGNEIEEKLEANDHLLVSKEGFPDSSWTVLDFGDIIVHIMIQDDRNFYKLESFWKNATFVDSKIWKKTS